MFMFRSLRSSFVGLFSGLILFSCHGAATPITSTSFNGWKASLTGSPTEADFTKVNFTNYNTAAGLTLNAVGNPSVSFNFTGPDNGNFQLTGTTYSNTASLQGPSDGGTSGINIAFPTSGENAFLLGLGDTVPGATLTLALSDGESFTMSSVSGTKLFGVALTHPVTSVFVSSSSGAPVIDDFYYGMSNLTQDSGNPPADPTPTAEGATAIMIAGGMFVVFGAKRKFERLAKAV